MATVEMRPAYQWTCEECGHEQFVEAIIEEMSEEDRLERLKQIGTVDEFADAIPEDIEGDFVSYPDKVMCWLCNTEYDTEHYSELDDDDDLSEGQ